jgi:hypothetical protein
MVIRQAAAQRSAQRSAAQQRTQWGWAPAAGAGRRWGWAGDGGRCGIGGGGGMRCAGRRRCTALPRCPAEGWGSEVRDSTGTAPPRPSHPATEGKAAGSRTNRSAPPAGVLNVSAQVHAALLSVPLKLFSFPRTSASASLAFATSSPTPTRRAPFFLVTRRITRR